MNTKKYNEVIELSNKMLAHKQSYVEKDYSTLKTQLSNRKDNNNNCLLNINLDTKY